MDTLDAIFTRKSTREFSDRPVEDEKIEIILRTAMSGPSAVNARDWEFLVVRDRNRLIRMADGNGEPAKPLKNAALGIMVLGNLERAFKSAPNYWIIDGAIAAQNMTIAAQSMGLGSVWLGTWPQMERVNKQREIFDIPDQYIPHSILAFGYPADSNFEERNLYEADKVHYEVW